MALMSPRFTAEVAFYSMNGDLSDNAWILAKSFREVYFVLEIICNKIMPALHQHMRGSPHYIP